MDSADDLTRLRPGDAGRGEVDSIDASRWPLLAAHWLAAGFDSPALVELACLAAGETSAAKALMPIVLAELGYPVPTEEEFARRCQAALDVVQRDLDATGYSQYQMRPVNLFNEERVAVSFYAGLPGGAYEHAAGREMRPEQDDLELIVTAADSVSYTLIEVLQINWPGCPDHDGYPMAASLRYPDAAEPDPELAAPWWGCGPGSHYVAPIGSLARSLDPGRRQADEINHPNLPLT